MRRHALPARWADDRELRGRQPAAATASTGDAGTAALARTLRRGAQWSRGPVAREQRGRRASRGLYWRTGTSRRATPRTSPTSDAREPEEGLARRPRFSRGARASSSRHPTRATARTRTGPRAAPRRGGGPGRRLSIGYRRPPVNKEVCLNPHHSKKSLTAQKTATSARKPHAKHQQTSSSTTHVQPTRQPKHR